MHKRRCFSRLAMGPYQESKTCPELPDLDSFDARRSILLSPLDISCFLSLLPSFFLSLSFTRTYFYFFL